MFIKKRGGATFCSLKGLRGAEAEGQSLEIMSPESFFFIDCSLIHLF